MKYGMYRAHLPDGATPTREQLDAALGAPDVRLWPKQVAMPDIASAISSAVPHGQINSSDSRLTGSEPGVLAPPLLPVA